MIFKVIFLLIIVIKKEMKIILNFELKWRNCSVTNILLELTIRKN